MIDLFEKCRKPSLASELKEKGIYPYFHALESRQDTEVVSTISRRSCACTVLFRYPFDTS